jgi:hypothetical protein
MKLRHKLIALLAFAVSTSQYADAAVTYSVDLDASTPEIDSVIDVNAGDTINGAVVMAVTGDTKFTSYNVALKFFQSELAFGPNILNGKANDPAGSVGNRDLEVMTNNVNLGASSFLLAAPAAKLFVLSPLSDDNPRSRPATDSDLVFDSFNGIGGDGGSQEAQASPLGFSEIGQIYLFTLTALGGTTSLDNNIQLVPDDPAFLNFSGDDTLVLNGARVSVAAVPEPSSLAVLIATAGIAGLRRRRR